MNFIPGSKGLEAQLKIPVFFTIIILYQGLISGGAFETPSLIKEHMKNSYFRMVSLLLIAISATKDIETAVIGLCIFLLILNVLRTEEEKKKLGSFFGIQGFV